MLAGVAETLRDNDELSDIVRNVTARALDVAADTCIDILTWSSTMPMEERATFWGAFQDETSASITRLAAADEDHIAVRESARLLDVVGAMASSALRRSATQGVTRDYRVQSLRLDSRLAEVRKDLDGVAQIVQARRESDEQARIALARARESDEARREAMSVAAATGDTALSKGFADLQGKETFAAGVWTSFAVATTFFGIGAGWATHMIFDTADNATGIVYPAVVALAFAGLAAYFARLGGHRRHTAQWAKSIAVQLDSYEKFIHHADEAARGPIFDRFAARVLGDPPARNAKNETAGFTVSDVMALMSKQP